MAAPPLPSVPRLSERGRIRHGRAACTCALAMLALPAACRRDPPLDSVPSTQVSVASAPSASSASPSASAAAPPSASVTPASEPSGEATLVIQRVESDCGTGPTGRNLLGYDV